MSRKVLRWGICLVGVLAAVQLVFLWRATRSPQWRYARKTFSRFRADYDLRNCVDLPPGSRKDFTNTPWKPMPCINTATSFYNPSLRAGNCNKFMRDPARWNFREVSADEAVPGDLMLFIRKRDGARHAGVYTMDSLLGPLCANTLISGVFVHALPVKPLLLIRFIGFRSVRYYRYVGGDESRWRAR